MVVPEGFDKITPDKFYVVELCKIKHVCLRQDGGRDVQIVANFGEIIEKVRIGQFFRIFIYELLADMPVRHQFSPNSHTGIIHERRQKVNRLKGSIRYFFCIV